MKELAVLGTGVCVVLTSSSCKSSESAYKKAYEKTKQQKLAEPQTTTPVEEVTSVVSVPVETRIVENTLVGTVREEKVAVVSGVDRLKDYNVVCDSFGVKVSTENLKSFLDKGGYNTVTAFNADAAIYRAIVNTYADKDSATNARDAFKAKYPNRQDLQGAWLLYRID